MMPLISRYRSVLGAFLALALFPGVALAATSWVTPEFAITVDDLQGMVRSMPQVVQDAILKDPVGFMTLMAQVLDQPAELLVLVDKEHGLPASYVPKDLVALRNYPGVTAWAGVKLRKAIMPAVLKMVAAAAADGITITFSSAYRSYEYQQGLYEREVKLYGKETADRESAVPGYSQHQLGTAIDFGSISDGYDRTPEGRWVAAHAWAYGFTISYPQDLEPVTGYRYESWHYRYITVPGALMQRRFFADVQQYFLVFLNDNRTKLEQMRMLRG